MRQSRKQAASQGDDSLNLGQLFSAALDSVSANRQQINELDGYNGNHGDNMVHNLQVITQALQGQSGRPPSDQLQHAAGQLQASGRGGTGQFYAQGLAQAAQQFQGKASLNQNDIGTLLQSVMGNVPVKPSASQSQAASASPGGDLGALLGALGSGTPQPGAPTGEGDLGGLLGALGGGTPQPGASTGEGDLGALLGMLGGGAPQAQPQANNVLGSLLGMAMGQPPQAAASQQPDAGLDLGDLLTAGMAFMQAKQQGADTSQAAMQAVMTALAGGQVNPLQSGSPQAAAGGLIAQSLLQAALGRK